MSTRALTTRIRARGPAIPHTVASLVASDWTVINGTGWTVGQSGSLLSIDCDNSGARDTTATVLSGLVLVRPTPLTLDYFGDTPTRWLSAMLRADEPDLTGLGIGIGFVNSTTAPTRWVARIDRRSASGLVNRYDEGHLASVTVGSGLTRRNVTVTQVQGLSSSIGSTHHWSADVGSTTANNATTRTQAHAQFDPGSGGAIYLAIFATVTVASAGQVLIRDVGFHNRPWSIPGCPAPTGGM